MKLKYFVVLAFLIVVGANHTRLAAEVVCDAFTPEPVHFKALYQKGKNLGKEICLSFGRDINSSHVLLQYEEFAESAIQAVSVEFDGISFKDDLITQMTHFLTLAKKGVDKSSLPTFRVAPDTSDLDSTGLIFQFTDWDRQGIAEVDSEECKSTTGRSCKILLESLAIAINQYKEPYVKFTSADFTEKVSVLNTLWERYFETARSQTLWDAVLTTTMEQDYLAQDRLVGPMPKQWFLVHPSIVIENVGSAAEGNQVKQALAVEWIGVNWWSKQSSPIGYPFGVSLASIYSDRPEVEDSGHGVMFTFNNAFSIGWADHDGDNGVYVTIDLLNLFAEKKERWNHYRDKIQDLKFSN